MSVITDPEYEATVDATTVPVRAGTIRLDALRAPHVEGDIVLAVEDPDALLALLDPRQNKRLITNAGGRLFDLGIRTVIPDRLAGTLTIEVASDEALTDDYAQLVDDETPRQFETSLRAVVNYVLGKVSGAALEPGPTDADLTAAWEIVNRLENPTFQHDAAGWTKDTDASALVRVVGPGASGNSFARLTAAGGEAYVYMKHNAMLRVDEGHEYTLSAYMRGGVAGLQGGCMVRMYNPDGLIVRELHTTNFPLVTNDWRRVHNTFTATSNATHVTVHPYFISTAAGQTCDMDAFMFNEGELTSYFDGHLLPDGYYDYMFEAGTDSPSIRFPHVERMPESLIWKAGTSALQFLAPLVQSAGFRLVCNERREWTLRDENYLESGEQGYRYAVNLTNATELLARSSDDWFDGAAFVYTWSDKYGVEHVRTDSYALTDDPKKVVLREIDAAYPGPGRAEYAVRRAQGKGRTVTVTAQATWDEAAEQPFYALLEGTPVQTGIAEQVRFDLLENTVTVVSRTKDTPPAAWLLIPAGQRWIDSPPGVSWIGEVI